MDDAAHRVLEDARRQLADASSEISQAVTALEADAPYTQVLALLGEATSRLQILDAEIARHLTGGHHEG
jgi:hypothetical protein